MSWLKRYPNLVVTRTFSKAYGLAGLRVGYALAQPAVADLMNRVRQPFNVNSLALAAAAAALDDMEFVARSYAENLQGMRAARGRRARAWASTTSRRTATSSPSASARRREIYKRLLQRGVIVRPVARLRHARAPARDHRHRRRERAVPRARSPPA